MSVHSVANSLILTILIYSVVEVNSGSSCNYSNEKPCAARAIEGESVVCVCNITYCDEFTREPLVSGTYYVAYTSSKAGSRFRKSYGKFISPTNTSSGCITTLKLDPTKKHQRVEGFGGAITDAAGINIMSLPFVMQESLINSYFSSRGLEYNMLRVPIGGTDFSTHYYAYNEVPADDPDLTNYTLSYEDYNYKLPVIKACMDVATSPVHIVGSVWSPPKWMKDPPEIAGVNHLKSKYLQTYALYHFKFLQLYSENGVPLWAIATTNEPLNGVLPAGTFQHLGWSAKEMGSWILDNLGPTIRNSSFKDVKILAVDDQRFSIPIWFNNVISQTPGSEKYIDGIAVHFYFDNFTPASFLKDATKSYPNIFVISTEASEGSEKYIDGIAVHFYFDNFTPASFLKDATKSYPNIFVISTEASEGAGSKRPVVLGSWERAESYIIDILEVVGWIDWNMCLDMRGGPNWDKNYVDSPIIVNAEKQEFYKQPMFYAWGHFSKFVTRGSRRIEITNTTICKMPKEHGIYNVQKIDECNPDKNIASYDSFAFQTPNSTNVVIIHNRGIENPVVIKYGDKEATLQLEAASITTVEFPAEFND